MTTTQTSTDTTVITTMLRQIGRANVLAISGGRVNIVDANTVSLPIRYGYRVDVTYDEGLDLYRVARIFSRAGRDYPKGTATHVHAEQLGDTAYRASCYHDTDETFGA